MKKLFVLVCLLVATATQICAQDSNDEVLKAGTEFFIQKKMLADSIQLEIAGYDNGCHILINRKKPGGFLLLADSQYEQVLDHRVLAYAIKGRHSWGNYKRNKTLASLLKYYGKCLKRLKEQGRHDTILEQLTKQWEKCRPLTRGINWNQSRLEAEFGGKSLKVMAGCVGIAESQLLRYWEHPKQMKGVVNFALDTLSEKLFVCNLDEITLNWEKIPKKRSKEPELQANIENLQAICGMTLFPKYGGEGTSAQFDQLKYSLTNYFDYSRHMHILHRNMIEPTDLLQAIYNELAAQRPVAISTRGHALILDGYKDGCFHLNFGWGGSCNGYYRLFTVEPYLTAIVGIEPNKKDNTETERTIEVKKAGTLSELLPETEAMNVRKLAVIGKLNAKDWKLIRRMAGATDYTDLSLPTGILQDLDLSKAHFVESKMPFLTLTGKQANMKSYINRNHTEKWSGREYKSTERIQYDTSKLTHEKLKELSDADMDRVSGFSIEEQIRDSLYLIHFKLNANSINPYMFLNCDNLQRIVFGDEITRLRNRTFVGCTALEHLTFHSKVIKFGNNVFRPLRRLRTIHTYSDSLNSTMFKNSFYPTIGISKP